MRKQKGFSLVEILIVVAIIMIISAIAIPNFLRSKMAANEASAVGSLHNIETAQVAYSSTYPTIGFAPDLNTLGPGPAGNNLVNSTSAGLLDSVLGCTAGVGTAPCTKSGYSINITAATGATPINSYYVNAGPSTLGTTGLRYFYVDPSGVIRYNTSVVAASADVPIS
jgi:prepilin-type N-terminal cleavage/methylation domain-containing protein